MSYKVIKILSKYSIVINYGQNSGASEGEKVLIYTPGEEIEFEGKKYGCLDRIKAELEIVMVYDNFSICEKLTKRTVGPLAIQDMLRKEEISIKELRVNNDDIANLTYRDKAPISLGDLVKVK